MSLLLVGCLSRELVKLKESVKVGDLVGLWIFVVF